MTAPPAGAPREVDVRAAMERLQSRAVNAPYWNRQGFEADLALVVQALADGVPYDIATECRQALEAAGMGKPGRPNTLWAMVHEATQALAEREGRIAALESVIDPHTLADLADAPPREGAG